MAWKTRKELNLQNELDAHKAKVAAEMDNLLGALLNRQSRYATGEARWDAYRVAILDVKLSMRNLGIEVEKEKANDIHT